MSNGILSNLTRQATIISASSVANKLSPIVDVGVYRTAVVQIFGATGASATVKVIGSNDNDLSSATTAIGSFSINGLTVSATSAAVTWNYLKIVNYDSGSTVAGSTGLSITGGGSPVSIMFEVNTNLVKFIAVELTSVSGGAVTVKISMCDNK